MSLTQAIQWRWPGARCVIRGGALERWDGPMAQPSANEIAQALTDYTANQPVIDADAATDGCLSTKPDLKALIACVAECCDISETDARARFTRHLRRIHRKANGL